MRHFNVLRWRDRQCGDAYVQKLTFRWNALARRKHGNKRAIGWVELVREALGDFIGRDVGKQLFQHIKALLRRHHWLASGDGIIHASHKRAGGNGGFCFHGALGARHDLFFHIVKFMRGETKRARALQLQRKFLQCWLPLSRRGAARNFNAVQRVDIVAGGYTATEITGSARRNLGLESPIHCAFTKTLNKVFSVLRHRYGCRMRGLQTRHAKSFRIYFRIAGHNCEAFVIRLHARSLRRYIGFLGRATKCFLNDLDHFAGIGVGHNHDRGIGGAIPLAVIILEILLSYAVNRRLRSDRVALAVQRTGRDALHDVITGALTRGQTAAALLLNNLALGVNFFWRERKLIHHI